jgi:hypothetical protein
MAEQTFTVRNNTGAAFNITGIQFNTPAGVRHVADLRNFTGGSDGFTGSLYTGITTLQPGQLRTFAVDHFYVSGGVGTRNGTIVVTASGGRTATINTSIVVSAATIPTYTLSRSAATVNEGQSFTITLTTTNVANGTTVPYTITGISSADIGNTPLTGVFTVQNGTASRIFNVTADQLTEGTETFVLTLTGTNNSVSVTINDTSLSPAPVPVAPVPPPPAPAPVPVAPAPEAPASYSLGVRTADNNPNLLNTSIGVGEGNALTFTLSGVNVPSSVVGQSIGWRIVATSGTLTPGDFNGSTSGTFVFTSSGNSTLSVNLTAVADQVTDGDKIFRFELTTPIPSGVSASPVSFRINDTSQTPAPQFTLSGPENTTVTEGQTIFMSLNNTNQVVTGGQTVGWEIVNVSTTNADFSAVSGTFTFPSGSFTATSSFTINSNDLAEPNEEFYVRLAAPYNAIRVPTTGNFVIAAQPSYRLEISPTTVNEGQSFTLTLRDDNNATPAGTTFAYFILNADGTRATADFDGFLTQSSGSISLNTPISLAAINDFTTEGNEVKTIQVRTGSVLIPGSVVASGTVTINDTSQTPVMTLQVSGLFGDGIGNYVEGSVFRSTGTPSSITTRLSSTTNLPVGTTVPYNITGDPGYNSSGLFTIQSGGASNTVTIPIPGSSALSSIGKTITVTSSPIGAGLGSSIPFTVTYGTRTPSAQSPSGSYIGTNLSNGIVGTFNQLVDSGLNTWVISPFYDVLRRPAGTQTFQTTGSTFDARELLWLNGVMYYRQANGVWWQRSLFNTWEALGYDPRVGPPVDAPITPIDGP